MSLSGLKGQVQALHGFGETHPVLLAESPVEQKRVWGIRKMGLGILASRPGDTKSISVIEDIAVPVEKLGEFVRGMQHILAEHNTEGDFYAHASAGCLHIRPLLNIKTVEGVRMMRQIAAQAVDLTLRLQGVVSGEHGVGISRAEWLPKMFGEQIMQAFRLVKQAADPNGILNPGKILDSPPMDTHLRYRCKLQPTTLANRFRFLTTGRAGRRHRAVQRCRCMPQERWCDVPLIPGGPGRDAQHARQGKLTAGDDLRQVPGSSPGRKDRV